MFFPILRMFLLGILQPIEYGFIVIVELYRSYNHRYCNRWMSLSIHSLSGPSKMFDDGIVRQVGVVLVILLEGVAVVFVES